MATTPQPDLAAKWWVVIDRERSKDLAVGPYPDKDAAVRAMELAPLIDGFCQDDALDCEAVRWEHPPAADLEVVIIDPADPHHTGA